MRYAKDARGKQAGCLPEGDSVTWLMLLLGIVVGMFSGVVGIGGGILFVFPALVWMVGMDQHRAQVRHRADGSVPCARG